MITGLWPMMRALFVMKLSSDSREESRLNLPAAVAATQATRCLSAEIFGDDHRSLTYDARIFQGSSQAILAKSLA